MPVQQQRRRSDTPAKPTPRAPATLVYVPGLGHDPLNSAVQVARSIAARADAQREDEVRAIEQTPPATAGLRAARTLVDGSDRPLLDVVELDYRDSLEGLVRDDGREGVAPGLVRQAAYVVTALVAWVGAAARPAKSWRAKLQLLVGSVAMLVMLLAFALSVLAVAASVLAGTPLERYLPAWATDNASWAALTFGLVSAGTFAVLRSRILRGGRRLRQLVCYFRDQDRREDVVAAVAHAVDKLRESGYGGQVHLLAYSFGSQVVLDAFTSAAPDASAGHGVRRTDSIVTVGCPADFVALYRPSWQQGRRALRPDLPWHNVFIASDVFGSNFQPAEDTAVQDATPLGWTVHNHRYLEQERLTAPGVVFTFAGLRKHNLYWNDARGCWNPSLLRLWGLLPPLPASPALPEPAEEPQPVA